MLQSEKVTSEMLSQSSKWSIAIFVARETVDTLAAAVRAADAACVGEPAVIEVLVNGNRELALQASKLIEEGALCRLATAVRVWSIEVGDKAHAWNCYVHCIWQPGQTAFFIDGYVEVKPDALRVMNARFGDIPAPLGVTGVPTSGRSAAALRTQMLSSGGLHGNMHAISAETMAAMRAAGFRLPLGLYRTDSLIGAVLMYKLDPAQYRWDLQCIAVEPAATWDVRSNSEFTLKNIVGQFKRILRQAQGDLENRAVREHLAIKRRLPQELPHTSRELVNLWLAEHGREAMALFAKRPARFYAARKLKAERDWTNAANPPELLMTSRIDCTAAA